MLKRSFKNPPTVALTGTTGFLGTHVALQLLNRNDIGKIHACVRGGTASPKLDFLKSRISSSSGSSKHQNKIEFFDADLTSPEAPQQYQNAFRDCDFVIHTAAVALAFARVADPKKEIVEPIVHGMKNVLDACSKTPTLKRLVFTSSQVTLWDVTIQPDYDPITQKPLTYTEKDFNTFVTSRPDCGGDYYGYAKTVAERMALDHSVVVEKPLDVVSLLPSAILGTCFTKAHSKASPVWIRNILQCNKQMDFRGGWVDVETVAHAHIEACLFEKTQQEIANGEKNRFILNAADCKVSDLALTIQKLYPDYKAEFHNLDADVLEKMAEGNEYLRLISKQQRFVMDNQLSRQVLGLEYPSLEETLTKTVDSLVCGGWVKPVMR